jgi:hypothetical protein
MQSIGASQGRVRHSDRMYAEVFDLHSVLIFEILR